MSTPAATMSKPPIRPYKRPFTSALHKRFLKASSIAFIACYIEALVLREKVSWFWAWFPIGPAGIRACLLFFSVLAVFMLRVASMHVGSRTTTSPIETVKTYLVPFLADSRVSTTLYTFGTYILSAWWFSETYIWSSPQEASLGWVNNIGNRTYEMNERPIFLRAFYLFLGAVQAVRHIYHDYDNLQIPVAKPNVKVSNQRIHPTQSTIVQARAQAVGILRGVVLVSLFTTLAFPFAYTLLFRSPFWSAHLIWAQLLFSLSRSSDHPSGFPPANPWMLFRCFWTGVFLLLLWESSSFIFTTLMAQEPLRKDEPLTAGLNDPNGTLLSGLKGKGEVAKTFAFWELALVSQKMPERRKAIFADIDRPGGPVWSQMLEPALDVIRSVRYRIDPSSTPKTQTKSNSYLQEPPQPLPRLIPNIKHNQAIFASTPPPKGRLEKSEAFLNDYVKSSGQAQPWSPESKAMLKKAARSAVEAAGVSHIDPKEQLGTIARAFQSTPAGWFFRVSPVRYAQRVILGAPSGNVAIIIDAVESVQHMCIASLSEDLYGKVQGTVPEVVKTFVGTLKAIQGFVSVAFSDNLENGDESRLAELETLETVLRSGLKELLVAFDTYLQRVGLTDDQVTEAWMWAGWEGKVVDGKKIIEDGSTAEDDPNAQAAQKKPGERTLAEWRRLAMEYQRRRTGKPSAASIPSGSSNSASAASRLLGEERSGRPGQGSLAGWGKKIVGKQSGSPRHGSRPEMEQIK